MQPFIILGLPRSRTFWLSRFLSYGTNKVGHDIAVECDGMDSFLASLKDHAGTVETGMAAAWPVLKRSLPDAKFIVIRRSVEQVVESFKKFNIVEVEPELRKRAQALDQFSRRLGVTTIQYDALKDVSVCAWLFQFCLGLGFDHGWWAAHDRINLQVDMAAELARIDAHADGIKKFKAEVAKRLPKEEPYDGPIIALEPFGSIWPECVVLGQKHFDEIEIDTDPRRKFALNRTLLSTAAVQGSLKIVTARIDTKLVGYCFWTVLSDPESEGLLVAEQGPWYVTEEAPARTAFRLYERSINELKSWGVKVVYPHHRATGRGSGLGKFFLRRGAVPEKQVYSLWIGD